jgi:hypothetical protein
MALCHFIITDIRPDHVFLLQRLEEHFNFLLSVTCVELEREENTGAIWGGIAVVAIYKFGCGPGLDD